MNYNQLNRSLSGCADCLALTGVKKDFETAAGDPSFQDTGFTLDGDALKRLFASEKPEWVIGRVFGTGLREY